MPVSALSEFDYTLKKKKWGQAIKILREMLEDDQTGQLIVRAGELGDAAAEHPQDLILDIRKNGTANLCYDGQYFYDTDHSEGSSGSQSNLPTGPGVTVANLKTDLVKAIKAFRKFKNDKGEIFHRRALQFCVVAPPDLEFVFKELLKATDISSTTNIYQGVADLVIEPGLTDTNDWYIDITNTRIKGFIYQNRTPVEAKMLGNDSEAGIVRDEWLWRVRKRDNAGYGLWQNSIKIVNS